MLDFPDNLSSSLSRLNRVIRTVPKKKKTAAAKKRVKKASKKKSVKKKTVKTKPLRFTRDKDGKVYGVLADGDEIPDFLQKKGITRLVDNITPGQELNVPASVIMSFFGDALIKRFLIPAKKKKSKKRT